MSVNLSKNKRGFILLLTLVFMTVLTVFAGSVLYMATYENRGAAARIDDLNMSVIADAGIERAVREIRDEILSSTPVTGTADLRGSSVAGDAGKPNQMDNILYYDEGNNLNMAADGVGTYVLLGGFDSSYMNTVIKEVRIGCYYRKSQTGGQNPSLELTYSTDGNFPQAGSSSRTIVLTNDNIWRMDTALDITNDRVWTWSIISNPSFQIRARAFNSTNRNVRLDYLFLQVIYEVDTLKEPWATGNYASFPMSLGNGTIQSVAITDEERKVHLNYASEALIEDLLTNLGVGSAATKAANIVNYRGALLTNPFDSVEELQQVTGITSADYEAIKDYFTVYSFVNSNVYRPTGPRAPVNINTAPYQVLKAVFDSINLAASDPATLADDVITFRNVTPFTCYYSSDAAVTTDLFDFIQGRGYLSGTQRNRVADNCDPSALEPDGFPAGYDCVTTEFCYASNAFYIDALARAKGRDLRVRTIRGNDGSHSFATYVGDPIPSGWRKENFE